ncbi:MAG: protein translocase subunit SecD [Legionellales bacterium]|nr:protein translocase subunit SecD [Legionellales bacterium]
MRNQYPWWKNALLIALVVVAIIYALPNLYPEDPAIQISTNSAAQVHATAELEQQVAEQLQAAKLSYQSIKIEDRDLWVRFDSTDVQLAAFDVLTQTLGDDWTVALNLVPSTPAWLAALGAKPMKQGLDLRGGVNFLLEVDFASVLTRQVEGLQRNATQTLREQRIRYAGVVQSQDGFGIVIRFRNAQDRDAAYSTLRSQYIQFIWDKETQEGRSVLEGKLSPSEINTIRQYTMDQTMSILRNRVNELGVGEAVVQQQGATRVAVDLPGIQDAARAKQILGGTATVEFRLVDYDNDPNAAQASGLVPFGSSLYKYNEQPILLRNQVILSGDSITSAQSTYDQKTAGPAVMIQLGGGGESLFTRTTRDNIGNLMAIVFVESKPQIKMVDGEEVRTSERMETVISVATIQGALAHSFQITGLRSTEEVRNLALLLRAGALPAAIYPVEERTIGPTLGKENIDRGIFSLQIGMLLVLLIMLVYYRMFGLVANVALVLNLVFLLAILSAIGATLTLPGIAGIVLTVGMAVDANVLIYERIREELRNGASPQAAIYAGYERAFATIVDANVTTLIVALILFAIGTGPVKGFAVTLSIGLLTSMLTAIAYTRATVNFIYGRRQVKRLSIGIRLPQAAV